MSDLYHDRWITCTDDAVLIRWYYLWGAKRIPYAAIRAVERVRMAYLRGKARVWGTANLHYWASLDPGRMGKQAALILDIGRAVRPFITPDDPDAAARVIQECAGLPEVGIRDTGPII